MNQVGLVTGAASGIGRACAILMAERAFDVIAVDLNEVGAIETAKAIETMGGRSIAVPGDVTDVGSMANAVARASELGELQAVVTAAGVFQPPVGGEDWGRAEAGRIASTPLATWDFILDVNLRGTFITIRAALSELGEGASIVTIASGAASIPFEGRSAYCVSKAGVWMLTKVAALECASAGVRVNCVAPGHILSPMTEGLFGDQEVRSMTEATIPLGRLGQPADVAAAVCYLLSDDAAYMTGQMLNPDGGLFTR